MVQSIGGWLSAFLDCDSEYIFSERLVNSCPEPVLNPLDGDNLLLSSDLIQRLSQSSRLLTARIQAGDTKANPFLKRQDMLLAVFILDLHLVSADRQSPCHQLQQNIVALSPSTNHRVFPCRLTIGLSGASLRAYRDGIFSVSRTDPRLKPTGDLGHWRYFAEILAFARLRPTSVVWCEYYIISICSVHSSVNLLPHFVRMMLFLWHKNARQSRNRVSSRNFGAAASSFGLSGIRYSSEQ